MWCLLTLNALGAGVVGAARWWGEGHAGAGELCSRLAEVSATADMGHPMPIWATA